MFAAITCIQRPSIELRTCKKCYKGFYNACRRALKNTSCLLIKTGRHDKTYSNKIEREQWSHLLHAALHGKHIKDQLHEHRATNAYSRSHIIWPPYSFTSNIQSSALFWPQLKNEKNAYWCNENVTFIVANRLKWASLLTLTNQRNGRDTWIIKPHLWHLNTRTSRHALEVWSAERAPRRRDD